MAGNQSLILALHTRYEAAWKEHDAFDSAQPPKPQAGDDAGFGEYFDYERALESIDRETEALREALLYQAPKTNEEWAILAYHAWGAFDPGAHNTDRDNAALRHALSLIFGHVAEDASASVTNADTLFGMAVQIAAKTCRALNTIAEGR